MTHTDSPLPASPQALPAPYVEPPTLGETLLAADWPQTWDDHVLVALGSDAFASIVFVALLAAFMLLAGT